MAKNVIMPALGMAQETGVLVAWLKNEGDTITKGEPIMEVETDKATVEIEAPESGILAGVSAAPGDEVPVGEVIAYIVQPGEEVPAPAKQAVVQTAAPPPAPPASAPPPAPATAVMQVSPVAARIAAEHGIDVAQIRTVSGRITKADVEAYLESAAPAASTGLKSLAVPREGRIPASPKARRLANERGLDLALLTGSGPDGAVLAGDVLGYSPAPAAVAAAVSANGGGSPVEIGRLWRVMAQRLTESWQTVPHFYLQRDVDATRFVAWRETAMKKSAEKLTFTDLLVKVVGEALRRHPRVNGSWLEDTIMLNEHINIGLAVAVEDGLVVPVIHEADTLSLEGLAVRRKAIIERAQAGRLKQDDIVGGTFTISNLGMYGVDRFNAIVNPPQAAILAVGRIAERAVPRNGEVAILPMMSLSLSCDHRVVDGARGAQFLDTVAGLIEEPMGLIP